METGMIELVLVVVPVLILLGAAMLVARQYRRCPSNRVLVIFGKVGGEKTARCVHGGGAFIVPMIQGYAMLSLEPMTLGVNLRGALSKTNIRVNVPSNFTVAVSTRPGVLQNAAERLLSLAPKQIAEVAAEIIFGQLRLVVASLTIEEINQDREKFLNSIAQNVDVELHKVGLEVLNVNITDITDESGYIHAIGKKAAAEAVAQAEIDVAQQERTGAVGVETARRARAVAVAQQQAESSSGQKEAHRDQRIRVAAADAAARTGENTAAVEVADSAAQLAVKRAEAARLGQVAEAAAERDVLRVRKEAEVARLEVQELAKQEVDKRRTEIAAEAQAQQIRRVAQGEADAVRARLFSEAEGARRVLEAKAEGYRKLIEAAGNSSGDAATFLLLEKMESIVKEQVKAVAGLKIDNIVVWDGGAKNGDSSTAKFLRDFVGTVSPLHGLAKSTGLKLPNFLGSVEPSGSVERPQHED